MHLIVVNTSLEGEQRRFKDEKTSTENAEAIGIQNRKDAKPKQKGCYTQAEVSLFSKIISKWTVELHIKQNA